MFHSWAGGFAVLVTPVHELFSECDEPPKGPEGSSTTHTFGSTLKWADLIVGGMHMGPGSAPATTTVVVTLKAHGRIETFDTEMTQLDISGGSLPPTVKVRQDPNQPTLGTTTEEHVPGGNFLINSFFDVFTQVSFDDGQTWHDADQPTRMTLCCCPSPLQP
jgi:hypothetical protein